jgi:uroporphyrinogen III methyltransferase/synthase
LYDSLIFTSVNGVKFFIQRFKKKRGDFGVLRNLRICAIGPQTAAAVEQLNLRVAVIPKEFRAESVLDALEEEGIRGRRFLLPRAEKAREILPEEIRKRGGYIDVVPAYRTGKGAGDIDKLKGLFQNRAIDVVTFTSSSTVRNFVELFSENDVHDLLQGCVIASIGPITAQTASALGIRTDLMPEAYTIQGLTQAIVEYFT